MPYLTATILVLGKQETLSCLQVEGGGLVWTNGVSGVLANIWQLKETTFWGPFKFSQVQPFTK